MMMRSLNCILLSALMSASIGCSYAITSIDPAGGSKYMMTGQEQIPFKGLRGFLWEGEYDPATKVMTVRKTALAPH